MTQAKWKNFTIEEIEKIVKECYSFRSLAIKLGYSSNSGSIHKTLTKVLNENNIDYSHFKGHAWNKKNYFDEDLNEFNTQSSLIIKDILIKERGNKCECCGISEWNGLPLTL